MSNVINFIKKINKKEDEFFYRMEAKTGIDAWYLAWISGSMIGIIGRYIICKLFGFDFWYPIGFKKK